MKAYRIRETRLYNCGYPYAPDDCPGTPNNCLECEYFTGNYDGLQIERVYEAI